MYEGINKLLEEDIFEFSNSDWSNPVVMIKIQMENRSPFGIPPNSIRRKIEANNSIYRARKRNVPILKKAIRINKHPSYIPAPNGQNNNTEFKT